MIILLIIFITLSIVFAGLAFISYKALKNVLWDSIENDPKLFVDSYFNTQTAEKYDCNLLITVKENSNFEGSAFDFSQYEEKNIIGLTEFRKTKKPEEDEPLTTILPNQKVYKMKDGSYQWDFRWLL